MGILAEDGTLLRELTIDPTRNYQPGSPARIGHYRLRQTSTMTVVHRVGSRPNGGGRGIRTP